MISFERAEKALEYRISTDSEVGRLKAYYEKMSDHKKVILSELFNSTTGTNAERTHKALASDEYKEQLELIEEAHRKFESVRAKRDTADLLIQMWRSYNSAVKKGNM